MERLYQIALTLSDSVGAVTAHKLCTHFGSAKAAYTAPKRALLGIEGISIKTANALGKKAPLIRAERELEFIEKHKIQVFYRGDPTYPRRLNRCDDAPLLLYYKGNADLNADKMISIVGTRNATNYGRSVCKDLIGQLAGHSPVIISGMAYGIDSYAHQNALDNGLFTVGVLGHGLDRIYPQSHRRLAEKMLENGGLLTEFTSQTEPERHNFPMRNRIIAGLADLVLVVEAPKKGGALITASMAHDYDRDVFAVPGSVYQEFSEGCNHLIKTLKASPVTSATDIAYLMNWSEPTGSPILRHTAPLTEEEKYIYRFLLEAGAKSSAVISEKSGLDMSRLSLILLQMELKGLLTKLPGNIYAVKGNVS